MHLQSIKQKILLWVRTFGDILNHSMSMSAQDNRGKDVFKHPVSFTSVPFLRWNNAKIVQPSAA